MFVNVYILIVNFNYFFRMRFKQLLLFFAIFFNLRELDKQILKKKTFLTMNNLIVRNVSINIMISIVCTNCNAIKLCYPLKNKQRSISKLNSHFNNFRELHYIEIIDLKKRGFIAFSFFP